MIEDPIGWHKIGSCYVLCSENTAKKLNFALWLLKYGEKEGLYKSDAQAIGEIQSAPVRKRVPIRYTTLVEGKRRKKLPLPPLDLSQKNAPNAPNVLCGDTLYRADGSAIPRAAIKEREE